jgi:hypothetical protein
MFGNRKRKLQDEEESLVPHGLVWHATAAEPTPEEVAKNEEALGYTVNYAQEIERVRREQSAQPIEPAPVIASQAPPAKPAVIPWWRMAQPEAPVERPISKLTPMPLSAYVPTPIEPALEPPRPSRIQPMQIRPVAANPVEIQPVAITPVSVQPVQEISIATPIAPPAPILQASATQVAGSMASSPKVDLAPASEAIAYNPPVLKAQIEDRLVPKSSEITESLALAFSRLSAAGKTAWLSLGSVSGKAVQRGRQTVQSLELDKGLSRAGKYSQNLIQGGISRTGRYARTTSSALGAFSRAGVSRARQMSARVRTGSTAPAGDVVRSANTQPSALSPFSAVLAASALRGRIIAAQQLSAWRLRRARMAVDSRFWTSMTLSAIAAIIALVIVSVVPHYAARSLPSRILNTNPSVNANVAAPVAVVPATVHKTAAPVRKTDTVSRTQTPTAKTDSVKADSAKAATNPKPKRVAQDDYVAPNTYKYYGTGSKASR